MQNRWKSATAGTVGIPLAADCGESLQGSGASLTLAVILALGLRFGCSSDQRIQELIGSAAVPIAPALTANERENGRLELFLGELGQLYPRLAVADSDTRIGAQVQVSSGAGEAKGLLEFHWNCCQGAKGEPLARAIGDGC